MRTVWTVVALVVSLLRFAPAFSQTPQSRDPFEARLAKLSPDRRAYERYRHWITLHPLETQHSDDGMQSYREYLKGQGFDEADIETQ